MLITQYIIIGFIVLGASFYLFKKAKAQFSENSCETGCGKCEVAKSIGKLHG